MQIAVMLGIPPNAGLDSRLGQRVAAPLRAFASRIDVEWVLGSAGWTMLVFAVVESGRML
jgi:hypothetical protein